MTRKHYVVIAAMLLTLALAITAMAATSTTNRYTRSAAPRSNQGMSTYNYGSLESCLSRVQLTTAQKQRINTIRQNGQRNMTSIRDNKSLTTAQRNQQLRTAQRNEINQIMAVLTPQQRTQFRSCITTRATTKTTPKASKPGGAGAGPSQVVPGVTSLSTTQRQQISSIRTREMQEVQAVQRDTSLSAAEKDARIRDIRTRAHNDVMNVLTPAQRTEFDNWWKQRSGSMSGSS